MGDPFLPLFSHFFNLFFQRFDLVFINFGVFLCQCHLHFFLDFEHLNFFDHVVQAGNEIFVFLQFEGLLGHADFAGFNLFHYFDFFVGVQDDFGVLFVDLGFADEEGVLEFGHWFIVVELDLTLFDSNLDLQIGLNSFHIGVDGL